MAHHNNIIPFQKESCWAWEEENNKPSMLPSEVSLNLPLLFFFLHFHGLKILPKPANLLFLLEGGVVSPDSRTSSPIPASHVALSASSATWKKTEGAFSCKTTLGDLFPPLKLFATIKKNPNIKWQEKHTDAVINRTILEPAFTYPRQCQIKATRKIVELELQTCKCKNIVKIYFTSIYV